MLRGPRHRKLAFWGDQGSNGRGLRFTCEPTIVRTLGALRDHILYSYRRNVVVVNWALAWPSGPL